MAFIYEEKQKLLFILHNCSKKMLSEWIYDYRKLIEVCI